MQHVVRKRSEERWPWKAVGAASLVAIAIAMWPTAQSKGPASTAPEPLRATAPAAAATLVAPDRVPDASGAVRQTIAATPADAEHGGRDERAMAADAGEPLHRLSVLAIGGDGAPLPRVALTACAVADPNHPIEAALHDLGYGASSPSARTNRDGIGVFERLEPGYHLIRVREGMTSTGVVVQVPVEGVQRIEFSCFRWTVRVLDAAGRPAVDARVGLRWVGERPSFRGWPDADGRADHRGRFVLMVAEERRALVRAVSANGTSCSPAVEVDVAPGHGSAPFDLVLASTAADASLALTAQCAESPLTVPFKVGVRDTEVGLWLRALRSEDAGADGVIRGLLPGRFRLELVDRDAEDEFYFASSSSPSIEVDLRAGEVTHAVLPVACHGRVRMHVRAPGLAPTELIEVHMSRAVPEERRLVQLGDGEPVEIGELFRLPLTRERVLPRALEPGRRIVTVSAPGFRRRVVELEVRAAEIVGLAVDLEPE